MFYTFLFFNVDMNVRKTFQLAQDFMPLKQLIFPEIAPFWKKLA